MSDGTGNGITPNAKRLLYGGFAAILAAGVGAAIRGGILANWGAEFGFTGPSLMFLISPLAFVTARAYIDLRPGSAATAGGSG